MNEKPGVIEILRSPEGSGGGDGGSPAGGGAPASTPSSAPAPSASPTPEPSSPSGAPSATPETPALETPTPLPEDAFAGFSMDESDEAPSEPPAVPTPKPAAEATPQATPPQQTPAPQTPQPQPAQGQPAATPPQPGQPGQPEATAPRLPTPAEPERIAQALLSDIEALSQHLAGTDEFKLSEKDIEAINEDVTAAIPQLMARTYIRAHASSMAQMAKVVPAMIARYMKVTEARDKSAAKFYARWPDIQKDQHSEVVDRLAATYRRENPSATLEQMVEELGPLVMMVAKIAPKVGAAAQQNGSGGQPQRPGGRMPPPQPFQPAVGGPASPPAATPGEDPWSGYGAQEDES